MTEKTTPLTDDEKQRLVDHSAWVQCPFCKGSGRILKSTHNGSGRIFDSYLAQERIINDLRAEIEAMRAPLIEQEPRLKVIEFGEGWSQIVATPPPPPPPPIRDIHDEPRFRRG